MHVTLIALLLLLQTASPATGMRGDPAPDAAPLTQADLLRRLIDVDRLYRPADGQRSGMFSSRPAGSQATDGGQFLRTQSDGWSVMAELNGPGALTRIWSPNPQGRLRFVLDDTSSFELEFADLFSGRTPPFEEPLCYVAADGGQSCYFPIGFAKGCRVLARDCASCYEISYVLFPPGTAVQAFTRELDAEAEAALDAVTTTYYGAAKGERPAKGIRTYALSNRRELGPGEKLSAESFAGGGIIRSLEVALTDRRLPEARYLLHQCVLRIYFDGQQQPAVEAPLIDFFGSGLTLKRFCSLLGGTDLWTDMPGEATPEDQYPITQESRFLYCYFPMPFADLVRIEIEAPPSLPKGRPLGLMLYARIERRKPPQDALRFHARFRSEYPCETRHHAVINAPGPGRIAGCVVNVSAPEGGWGQALGAQIWIDGQRTPRYVGAGMTAFAGSTSRKVEAASPRVQPLHGVTASSPFGKYSGFRWFLPDSIEFEQSARFVIENGQEGGAARGTSYSTLVYWYADPQAGQPVDSAGRPFFTPLTLADLTPPPLRIAGAVEVEDHVTGGGAGRVLKEQYADGAELSDQRAAIISSDGPVQINIPSQQERDVLLSVRMHQLGSRYFDTVEVYDPAGALLGTIEYDRNSGGFYPVGRLRLKAGDNLLRVVCSKQAVLDCWILEDAPPDESAEAAGRP